MNQQRLDFTRARVRIKRTEADKIKENKLEEIQ
jgi:hypothetical protein